MCVGKSDQLHTRSSNRPRSAQLIVTCLISSSNVWAYSSSRIGQMPVSLAWRCCKRWSKASCKLITSKRVAGVLETYCTQSCPSSVHSRGGRIEFKISSVWVGACLESTGGNLPFCFDALPFLVEVLTNTGFSYFTKDGFGGIIVQLKACVYGRSRIYNIYGETRCLQQGK